VGGGSAGGHIAACTAIAGAPNSDTDDLRVSCIPNALLLYYPVASLVDDPRVERFTQALGGKEMVTKLSPARQVTRSWPPTSCFPARPTSNCQRHLLQQAQEAMSI
jgi:acetyl esterase/lipase